MSEQQPERTPKPPVIRLTCEGCDHNYDSSILNARYYIYTKQHWFDNLQVRHNNQHCEEVTVIFPDKLPNGSTADSDQFKAIASQYPTSIYEYLEDCDKDEENESDFIKYRRKKVMGIEDIEPHELVPRQREYVEHWGEFLQRIVVDDRDFVNGTGA